MSTPVPYGVVAYGRRTEAVGSTGSVSPGGDRGAVERPFAARRGPVGSPVQVRRPNRVALFAGNVVGAGSGRRGVPLLGRTAVL